MRAWLNKWQGGYYEKVLEMEDDRVIMETEEGKRIREEFGIKTAEELFRRFNGANMYLFSDTTEEDYEKLKKAKRDDEVNIPDGE